MISTRTGIATACLLLGLCACAASPPVRYFQLSAMDLDPAADSGGALLVAFGPLTLPDYLDRPQIVTRGAGASTRVDELNRWAEPLEDAVPRIVAANVDALLEDTVVLPFTTLGVSWSYRLFGSITRFDADRNGEVMLLVQWGATGTDGRVALPIRTGRYLAKLGPEPDPASAAEAMTGLLADFSKDVAAAIGTLPPPRTAVHSHPAPEPDHDPR